jgi:hypothetical protein
MTQFAVDKGDYLKGLPDAVIDPSRMIKSIGASGGLALALSASTTLCGVRVEARTTKSTTKLVDFLATSVGSAIIGNIVDDWQFTGMAAAKTGNCTNDALAVP